MNKTGLLILSSFFIFYLFWHAIPVSLVGTDDFRMVDAFNVDESEFLSLVKNEVKSHEFNMRFYSYSHLYFNLGLVFLVGADYFFPVTEQHIIVLFRFISAFFFLATVLITFLTAKKVFGKITAWLSVILLFITSSQLYSYSTMFHPDTTQLFFISLSIFYCCKYFDEGAKRKWKHLAFASCAAGLAFSTKYAGVMLLPIIVGIDFFGNNVSHYFSINSSSEKPGNFVPVFSKIHLSIALFFCLAAAVVLHKPWIIHYVPVNENSENFYLAVLFGRLLSILISALIISFLLFRKKIFRFKIFHWLFERVISIVLLSVVFTLAFAITSPGCVRGLNFVNGFITVTDLARHGHWFRDSLGISGWTGILVSEGVLNIPVFILFVFGALFSFLMAIKNKREKVVQPIILISWIAIYLTVLVNSVNAAFSHYLIPLLPCIIILSAGTIERISHYLSTIIPMVSPWKIAIFISVVFLGYPSFHSIKKIISTRNTFANKVEDFDSVKAGLWMEENVPADTRIIYDRYAYIPKKFETCFATWGITERQISETMAGMVVANYPIYQNFSDSSKASSFLAGGDEYLEKHNFYKSLLSGNSDFKLLKDFGNIKIFSSVKKWEKNILFSSVNSYESNIEKWSFNNVSKDTVTFFGGKNSESIAREYSSTFSCSLGEIFGDTIFHPVYLMAEVQGWLGEGSSAFLVIDFCRNGKSISWEGKNFEESAFNYNQWTKISAARRVPYNSLPTDMVKIFVWNNSGKKVLIDDFKVEAYTFK